MLKVQNVDQRCVENDCNEDVNIDFSLAETSSFKE